MYNLFGGVSQSAAICELVHRCVYLSVVCVCARLYLCVCVLTPVHVSALAYVHVCVRTCVHVCVSVCEAHVSSYIATIITNVISSTYLVWECACMLYSVLELCALVGVWVGM